MAEHRRIQLLADMLGRHKVPVLRLYETDCPDIEDDAIYITEKVHITLGPGYTNVVAELPDGTMKFYPSRHYMNELLVDINEALTWN